MGTEESGSTVPDPVRGGLHHWWAQRLTAIALLPLGGLFLVPFAGVAGGEHAAMAQLYGDFWHALVAALFLAVCSYHLCLGLRVVVEDYVQHHAWRAMLLITNALGCTVLAVAGILAVARLAGLV